MSDDMCEDEQKNRVKINRPLYNQEDVQKNFEYEKPTTKVFDKVLDTCASCKPQEFLTRTIPILQWLPNYKWRTDLSGDIIAGITVAIMHIPQGMGYSLLGNVPAIIGIYMAFFPVLVYSLLGTSRHNSMGTFAVICLMTGKAVVEYSHPSYFAPNAGNASIVALDYGKNIPHYSPIEVATAVTFMVAIYQILMYFLRLGVLSTLLSETLVSGFCTGAAVQVFTSQMKDLLGLTIPRQKGYFEVIKTYGSIWERIDEVNLTALLITGITITALMFNNVVLKPIVAKRSPIPVPIELLAVVIGTLVSYFYNLHDNCNVNILGHIPSGLPEPHVPDASLMKLVAMDAFMIAVVSYAMTLSMALIFGQKHNYEIDANQELLAQGAGNAFSCFFSCMPFTASISRSLIQESVGGNTQLTSLVSCSILFLVLLWIGPYFETLPKCVLASIIVVALKGMLMQVTDLLKFWKMAKIDAAIWLITFLTVAFVGVDIGLLVGVVLSLSTVTLLALKPYTCLLRQVPNTDIYLDTSRYKKTIDIPDLKIFHYRGGISFASRNTFKSELLRLLDVNPQKQFLLQQRMEKYEAAKIDTITNRTIQKLDNKQTKLKRKIKIDFKCIILDFSAVSYIDPSGVLALKSIATDFQKIQVRILITGCSGPVYEKMKKCNLFDDEKLLKFFPTIHDGVQWSKEELCNPTLNSISIIENRTYC